MKRIFTGCLLVACALCALALRGATFEEQMRQAEQLATERKFQEAATAFDDASLETENAAQRIEARYRSWECLRAAGAKNAVTAAESLLYDESELSNDRKVELVSYIVPRYNEEQNKKVLEFALGLKGLDETQRSRMLQAALKVSVTWQSEAYVEEILAMKAPAPEARANALGHRANVFLWQKRDAATALQYINEALLIKELDVTERQFFLLVQARANGMLKRFAEAEQSYQAAIINGRNQSFLDAAYKESFQLFIHTKQWQKIRPLLKGASEDKRLEERQRQVFANLLLEIETALQQKQKNQ